MVEKLSEIPYSQKSKCVRGAQEREPNFRCAHGAPESVGMLSLMRLETCTKSFDRHAQGDAESFAVTVCSNRLPQSKCQSEALLAV